ncbi:hypothetical protein BKA69DRAFT_499846 [Paraphysoderma sedebokerense]|nr:hypothetical protein BKA69DRAFT_499846 [Paraphysoderma sedebokerense]
MSPVEPPLPSPQLNSAEPYQEDLQRPGHTFPPMAPPPHQYQGNRNHVHSAGVEDVPPYRRYSDPYRRHPTNTDKTRPPYNGEPAPPHSLTYPPSMGKPQPPRNVPVHTRLPPHSALRESVSSFAPSDSEYHSHDSYDSGTYDSGYSSREYRRRNPRLDHDKYARDRVIHGQHNGEVNGETDFGRNESVNVNLNPRPEPTDVFVKPTSFRPQFSKPRSSSSPAPIHRDLSAPLPLPPSPLNSGHPRLPSSYPVQPIRDHPSQPLLSPPLVDSPGEMPNRSGNKKIEVNGNIDISDFTPRERFLFSQNELLFDRMTALENAVVGVLHELKRNDTIENKLQGLENQVCILPLLYLSFLFLRIFHSHIFFLFFSF